MTYSKNKGNSTSAPHITEKRVLMMMMVTCREVHTSKFFTWEQRLHHMVKKAKKKKETVQLFNLLAQLSKRKHILGWLSHKFHIHVCRQPNGVTVRSALLANQQWSVALPASTCNAGGSCMRMSVVKTCKKKNDAHTHAQRQCNVNTDVWSATYKS